MEKLTQLRQLAEIYEKEILTRLVSFESDRLEILSLLEEKEFYVYKKQFQLLVECISKNLSISTEFIKNGLTLSEFIFTGDIRQLDFIIRDVKNTAQSIKLFEFLQSESNNLNPNEVTSITADMQSKLLTEFSIKENTISHVSDIISEFQKTREEYKTKKANGNELIGISTGFKKLDNAIDGLRKGHLWIIAGYTNMGKTSTTVNIIANLIKQKKRVVFYSLEMTSVDIFARLLGVMTEDNNLSIIKGYEKNEDRLNEVIQEIEKTNFTIHTDKYDLSEIVYSMYKENLTQPVDLFVVDFIQNVTIKNTKSEYETTTTSALELQQCAKRLKVPIIALSQISNDSAKNEDSVVMGFKGSGAIASASDFAIEIKPDEDSIADYRTKLYQKIPVNVKWVIKKNRHGSVGEIKMIFNGKTGTYIDKQEQDEKDLSLFTKKNENISHKMD